MVDESPRRSDRLILASTSVYRRQLLERLGLKFECVAPGVDESTCPESIPLERARRLAYAKAVAVSAYYQDAVVIGSDQVLDFDGLTLGKPGTDEAACLQLRQLAGREHRLITAVALSGPSGIWTHHDVTRLVMRPLSDREIARYVERDRPLDCAGSYKFESLGVALFSRIESEDPTAIVGLPLMALVKGLRFFGIPVL